MRKKQFQNSAEKSASKIHASNGQMISDSKQDENFSASDLADNMPSSNPLNIPPGKDELITAIDKAQANDVMPDITLFPVSVEHSIIPFEQWCSEFAPLIGDLQQKLEQADKQGARFREMKIAFEWAPRITVFVR